MDQKAVQKELKSLGEIPSSPPAPTISDPQPAVESDPDPSSSSISSAAGEPISDAPDLLESWKKTIPVEMQDMVSRAIRRRQRGQTALVGPTTLWLYPPEPPASPPQPPSPAPYFACPLFLWFPYRLWHPALRCPQPECAQQGYRLVGAGYYKTIRRVLDINGWYYVATENLECQNCHKKLPAWAKEVMAQLDVCLQLQFSAVLSYKLACDRKVVKLLQEGTAGHSVAELYRHLAKWHHEAWMQRCLKYLLACSSTSTTTTSSSPSSSSGPSPSSSTSHPVLPPPPMDPLPSVAWLREVLNGQEDQLIHLSGAVNKLSQRLLKRKLVLEEEEESSAYSEVKHTNLEQCAASCCGIKSREKLGCLRAPQSWLWTSMLDHFPTQIIIIKK